MNEMSCMDWKNHSSADLFQKFGIRFFIDSPLSYFTYWITFAKSLVRGVKWRMNRLRDSGIEIMWLIKLWHKVAYSWIHSICGDVFTLWSYWIFKKITALWKWIRPILNAQCDSENWWICMEWCIRKFENYWRHVRQIHSNFSILILLYIYIFFYFI